jgi:hypothetical protein
MTYEPGSLERHSYPVKWTIGHGGCRRDAILEDDGAVAWLLEEEAVEGTAARDRWRDGEMDSSPRAGLSSWRVPIV